MYLHVRLIFGTAKYIAFFNLYGSGDFPVNPGTLHTGLW